MTDDADVPRRSPLLPDRSSGDFFLCDILDAAPKGDMASMEHPVFSLSTRPDTRPRRYEHGPHFIEVSPSIKGLATVFDRDILIYCISQVMAALNEGRPVSRTVRFKSFNLMKATNRMTNGQAYEGLKSALERLRGTTIVTNIITGSTEQLDGFGLIDSFRIVRETREGRMQDLEVTLSDWVFNAIRSNEVLTLSHDYFRLRRPLERRIYELARKHCGRQQEWRVSLPTLQQKCGSGSTEREFRRLIRRIAAEDEAHAHIPDYAVRFDEEAGQLCVFNRQAAAPSADPARSGVRVLDPEVYETARRHAPGWDVYMLEREWRAWCVREEIEPKRPEAHFLKFCQTWAEHRQA